MSEKAILELNLSPVSDSKRFLKRLELNNTFDKSQGVTFSSDVCELVVHSLTRPRRVHLSHHSECVRKHV